MRAVIVALITVLGTIIGASISLYFTKRAERAAQWRAKKLAYYEEFFAAVSGIVGELVPHAAHIRFADAVNNLHLVGSQGVIDALHKFCDEIAVSNKDRSRERHDRLWSGLVWQIRADLQDLPGKALSEFRAVLWAPGAGTNMVLPDNA